MKIVIYIYNGITMLDAIGPYEVLRNIKDVELYFVAENKGEIKADSGFIHLNIKYDINDIENADVLIIPGSTITFIKEMKNKKVLNWINKIDKTTQWTTSVCSGSLILAASGLLKNKDATSHWNPKGLLNDYGATPKNERIIKQGKYITSAGVSAGIDMALYLSNVIVGEEETKTIQLMIEYDPNPIYDSGNIAKVSDKVIKKAKIKLTEDAKKEIGLIDLLKYRKILMKIKKFKH